MVYLQLLWEFLKIGLFSIGGGLAALPYLYELAERYPWFTTRQITDMVAIAESTPGPIGINAATFAGYQAGVMYYGIPGGMLGGVVATFGFALPGFIISLMVAKFLMAFQEKPIVRDAFYGLRPAVTALIASACLLLTREVFFSDWDGTPGNIFSSIDIKAVILLVAAFFAVRKWNKHPVVYIGAGAAVGIALYLLGIPL